LGKGEKNMPLPLAHGVLVSVSLASVPVLDKISLSQFLQGHGD